jgi:hypothetical protein
MVFIRIAGGSGFTSVLQAVILFIYLVIVTMNCVFWPILSKMYIHYYVV